ncbi:hypothetical protein [Methylobacterium trifolii]|uniref:Serine/threonine protein kinase n=1 Tax=Methylobacterium trifolii TaxID=1003092 RepID=A0ABQ4TXI1_9HYPH|nr:hypothetical protein [Methylobacterium trifolii]GJE59382.1 hypothetical protein MPOCJGCO_1473 [Methylobacterium trifolii]
MKLATMACLAALSLIAPTCLAARGAAVPQDAPAPAAAKPAPQPAAQPNGEPQATAATPRAAAPGTRAERRRRSYAACNRASHQRSLRGGKRRRFLIRCRLGYERTRLPQAVQPGAPPQPAANPPARRP